MERLARSAQHLQAAPTATDGTIGGGTDFGGVEFFTLEEVGAPDPDAGLRITMLPGLPGLWAEALKNLCDVKGVSYKRVIHPYGDRDAQAFLYELTAQRSLPTMLYNDDPPRSALIEQIQLAEKLAAPGAPLLIPANAQDRVTMFGLLNELAGERGVVYQSRLSGGPKSPLAVKYGYSPAAAAAAEGLFVEGLGALSDQLVAQQARGSQFFVGDSISVLDVYWATMSLMFDVPGDDIMPRTKENRGLIKGFGNNSPSIAEALSPLLIEHRDFIYRNFLVTPAVIGGRPL